MSSSFKIYILALGVLTLDTANAQLCSNDHGILSHNVEIGMSVTCEPGDPDTYLGLTFDAYAEPYRGLFAGAWCVDVDRNVYCGRSYQVDSYSSYDSFIPEGAVDRPDNLDLLNWLINHHPIGGNVNIDRCYTGALGYQEYQQAIWKIIDDRVLDLGGFECITDYLVGQARSFGNGYEPDCSNPDAKIGVILVADANDGTITNQVLMAEIILADVESICDCENGGAGGDPHFKTWSGEMYDFHGVCDLTLLSNPQFMNGLGMDINIRSKKIRQWSYISTAAIRIGREIFEVAGNKVGDTYWLNGKEGHIDGMLMETLTIARYQITFQQVHSNQREYTVHISQEERIVFTTWKNFVRVNIKAASRSNFHDSLGLMGSFDQKGAKLGRNGVAVFNDINKFGMEWQVLVSEPTLFHEVDGPQRPELCELPSQKELRRRLIESEITGAEAELACHNVKKKYRNMCIFDVIATNDKDVAGAY